MEQLNRIELRGMVGSINTQVYGGSKVARITVATNRAYRDRNGEPVIETEWHNVTVWENKSNPEIELISKGTKVYVVGRLHYQKFTGSDGIERKDVEVQANRIMVIDEDAPLSCEM